MNNRRNRSPLTAADHVDAALAAARRWCGRSDHLWPPYDEAPPRCAWAPGVKNIRESGDTRGLARHT